MPLEYEEETYILRRCFFDVQNEVGLNRKEEAYHQACVLWFREHGVPVASKPPHRLMLKGELAHSLFPDFVYQDSISVEMKAEPRHLSRAEFVQLFDYLKCRGDRIGLLVNMGLERVQIERVIYEAQPTELAENWDSWTGRINGDDRRAGTAVRSALQSVYAEHATGYGDEVLTRLILCALQQEGLSIVADPVASAFYRDVEVHRSPLSCLVVNSRIVFTFSTLFDSADFSVNRGRSYLQALDLRWGVAANFGKTRAEIVAIRRGR